MSVDFGPDLAFFDGMRQLEDNLKETEDIIASLDGVDTETRRKLDALRAERQVIYDTMLPLPQTQPPPAHPVYASPQANPALRRVMHEARPSYSPRTAANLVDSPATVNIFPQTPVQNYQESPSHPNYRANILGQEISALQEQLIGLDPESPLAVRLQTRLDSLTDELESIQIHTIPTDTPHIQINSPIPVAAVSPVRTYAPDVNASVGLNHMIDRNRDDAPEASEATH